MTAANGKAYVRAWKKLRKDARYLRRWVIFRDNPRTVE
jgi:hypothetical protein